MQVDYATTATQQTWQFGEVRDTIPCSQNNVERRAALASLTLSSAKQTIPTTVANSPVNHTAATHQQSVVLVEFQTHMRMSTNMADLPATALCLQQTSKEIADQLSQLQAATP